ncbi:MAG: hypothetical protein ACE5G2_03835 [Candidatus Krumholzibacteriia bacterium]
MTEDVKPAGNSSVRELDGAEMSSVHGGDDETSGNAMAANQTPIADGDGDIPEARWPTEGEPDIPA